MQDTSITGWEGVNSKSKTVISNLQVGKVVLYCTAAVCHNQVYNIGVLESIIVICHPTQHQELQYFVLGHWLLEEKVHSLLGSC